MASSGRQNNGEKSVVSATSHPLFYSAPCPITLERHATAGLHEGENLNYARATNSIPLNAIEFAEAARSYPIVFTSGAEPMPVALVGLENENYFINIAGRWREDCYVPAYVRKYPFALMESPDRQQWILCVDEAAKNFAATAAAHPFYHEQQAAEITTRALDFCTAFQQHYRMTRDFVQGLVEQKLLVERVSTLKLPDGSSVNLRGFMTIDEERFQKLSDEIYLDWRRLDWIALIHMTLQSSVNWKYIAAMATGELKRT
ncbi:MAG: SapC family protein [Rickettsiales bacterium]|nr:SapC family protein [Rickettsiales bacterium]